jgi:hypothetical protein
VGRREKYTESEKKRRELYSGKKRRGRGEEGKRVVRMTGKKRREVCVHKRMCGL